METRAPLASTTTLITVLFVLTLALYPISISALVLSVYGSTRQLNQTSTEVYTALMLQDFSMILKEQKLLFGVDEIHTMDNYMAQSTSDPAFIVPYLKYEVSAYDTKKESLFYNMYSKSQNVSYNSSYDINIKSCVVIFKDLDHTSQQGRRKLWGWFNNVVQEIDNAVSTVVNVADTVQNKVADTVAYGVTTVGNAVGIDGTIQGSDILVASTIVSCATPPTGPITAGFTAHSCVYLAQSTGII